MYKCMTHILPTIVTTSQCLTPMTLEDPERCSRLREMAIREPKHLPEVPAGTAAHPLPRSPRRPVAEEALNPWHGSSADTKVSSSPVILGFMRLPDKVMLSGDDSHS